MIPKPSGCDGCVMYGDGKGFVPDELVPQSRVAIVGQAPGAEEERAGRPFVGATGQVMEREYYPQGQIPERAAVHHLNILKCRWQPPGAPRTNVLPPVGIRKQAVTHCLEAHFRLPDVDVVLPMGALASETLGCPGSVSVWRGFAWELPEGIVRRI